MKKCAKCGKDAEYYAEEVVNVYKNGELVNTLATQNYDCDFCEKCAREEGLLDYRALPDSPLI